MSQHFLLSAKARTLSLSAVMRMSVEEAEARFTAIRWAETDEVDPIGWTEIGAT